MELTATDFKAIFEAMPGNSALLLTDAPHFTIIAATDKYMANALANKKELYGKGLFEAFPSRSNKVSSLKENLSHSLEKVIQTGEPDTLPIQPFDVVKGSFAESYWHATNKPVLDSDGQVQYIIHTVEEITEKIQSTGTANSIHTQAPVTMYNHLFNEKERVNGGLDSATDVSDEMNEKKKLEKSEQRVRSLVESAPFPIGVYIGREMRIELTNQAILEVWGRGNDVVGKLYAEVLPELENQNIYEQLDEVYTTGKAFHAKNQKVDLEIEGRIKSFYFNYSFTPLFDGAGQVYGIMNTAADVTDLIIEKKKSEESERNLRTIIRQAPVAMCILTGPNHVVEIANERMFEIWGKSEGDVISKPIFEGLPEAKEQGLEALLNNTYAKGETFSAFERPVNLPRGAKLETTYLNFVYEPFYETDSVISGVMAVAIDVTEQVLARHKIEEIVTQRTKELAEANSALKRNNEELEQFAYIASHDMQEPLRKVSTFTQMLENSLGQVDERSKIYLDKIGTSTARMLQLVRDVLNFSQLSREQVTYALVDLNKLIDSITADFELLIEQKGAKVAYENLHPVEAIPLQMQQLFSNLISNALKFNAPDNPPVVEITSDILAPKEKASYPSLQEDRDYLVIRIKDNGIGFSPEYRDRIFAIFQRLHGRSEFAGTGIGLALCKKIVQNHGGEISAESKPGKGAVFTIVLPQNQANY